MQPILANISIYSGLIVLLYSMFVMTKEFKRLKLYLFFLVFIGILTDALMNYFDYFRTLENESLVENIFEITSVFALTFIFSDILKRKKEMNAVWIVFSLHLSFTFCQMYINEGLYTISSILYPLLSTEVLFFCFYYLWVTINRLEVPNLFKHPPFIVVVALLFYYGGPLFVSLFEEYLIYANNDAFAILWPIFSIITTLFHLISIRALWTMKGT